MHVEGGGGVKMENSGLESKSDGSSNEMKMAENSNPNLQQGASDGSKEESVVTANE